MADLAQVEAALVTRIAQAAYPSGTGAPSAAGAPVKIFRGWPNPAALDADLAAGKLTVSVYPTDVEQRTTRHTPRWIGLPLPSNSLALTVSGTTVTASGTPASPLNAAVLVNNTKAYVYAVQPGDTLASVAAGLATLVTADTPATSSGPVLTVPAAKKLVARVGAVGSTVRELRRQKRGFQIALWCPTPAARDTLAALVDAALAATPELTLPDGTAARLLYERSPVTDRAERDGLYRRDLVYSAEYSTTASQAASQIVAELLNAATPDGVPLSATAT